LPPDSNNRTGMLVFVDRLSKMVHLSPVSDRINDWTIYSYILWQSLRLAATFWRALLTLLGSKLSMSTADHPETDGQTERVNHILGDMLRSYANTNPKHCSSLLPAVKFAINNVTHSPTGFPSFSLCFMRHPRLPHVMVSLILVGKGIVGTPHANPLNQEMNIPHFYLCIQQGEYLNFWTNNCQF